MYQTAVAEKSHRAALSGSPVMEMPFKVLAHGAGSGCLRGRLCGQLVLRLNVFVWRAVFFHNHQAPLPSKPRNRSNNSSLPSSV